ncbi:hypothetical protein SAMN05216389_106174 [Oceanobacillus limi]|uniref:Uncharacterized protein n=1 Tax=Oceanobacillus limi TaxID=930131 RepID=A0A1I0CDQ8_9BACI|nr:hypothetical protein [Oceanobacillus limi]SET17563.1 hypothetical protein SAMN05216389_106174 [Oceanobacillus limi]
MNNNQDYKESEQHFDGIQESIINDPLGKQMGLQVDTKEDPKNKNPYNVKLKKDPQMDKLK